MRFTIEQDVLHAGLKAASRALSVRSAIPALSGIHLEARGAELSVRATDMELTVQKAVRIDLVREGAIVLPGRTLTELVRRLPPGPVAFTVDQGQNIARIGWQGSECVVQGFGSEQFPAFAPAGMEPALSIPADHMRRLLRETGFATGNDEARPWFTGVYLTIVGSQVTAMATDTAIVAYSEAKADNLADLACSLIIPGRSLQELERLLAEGEDDRCLIAPSHNQLLFRVGDLTLVTRLLEGQYPDFRRLLPTHFPGAVRLDRRLLIEALERTNLLAAHGAVQATADGEQFILFARSPDVGQLTERLPGALHGSPFTVPLNGRFLTEGLKSMTSPTVMVEFHSARTAVRFRADPAATSFFAVLPLLQF